MGTPSSGTYVMRQSQSSRCGRRHTLSYQFMRTRMGRQIPNFDSAILVAGDQLALVCMHDGICDGCAVIKVASENWIAARSGVPDL